MPSLDDKLKHKYFAQERVARRVHNVNARKPSPDKSLKPDVVKKDKPEPKVTK